MKQKKDKRRSQGCIEELKSGSYRITIKVDGKKYRKTIDHKPTASEEKDIIAELRMLSHSHTATPSGTFEWACEAYIDGKSNVLSVSTIRGYRNSIMKHISDNFMKTKLSDMTLPIVQAEINRYAVDHAPKSVRNLSGFIMGVLNYYSVNIPSPKLPQKEAKTPYVPTEEEVKQIFAEIKGSRYEAPIMLAAMGLRRSEIYALTIDDLDGNILTINKAKVQQDDLTWVIKSTKTVESTRQIVLPDYLADLIRNQGYVYDGSITKISKTLIKAEKKLGIEHFPLHKLRHFFASYMHDLGYSDKQIQDMGGWKTDNVMKTVYTHGMRMAEAKAKAAEDINTLMAYDDLEKELDKYNLEW